MPETLDPILCPCNISGVFNATYVEQPLVNIINLYAIRIENKGPYDVKFSGVGIRGSEWIPAGMSIPYRIGDSNQGQLKFIAYSSNANSSSQFYDTAGYSTILVTTYQIYEEVDLSRYAIPIIGPSADISVLDVPSAQGTTVTVPMSNGTFLPFTNKGYTYLLGFDLTKGSAAANASGNLVVQGLSGQDGLGSTTLTYRIHSVVDPTEPVIMSVRYPRPGITSENGSNIQFIVPAPSTMTIDLCIFYSWNIGE